jgi:hypothetical protein
MVMAEGDDHDMTDAELITRARQLGPELRASTSDRERLAGWLLKELADRLEQAAGHVVSPA